MQRGASRVALVLVLLVPPAGLASAAREAVVGADHLADFEEFRLVRQPARGFCPPLDAVFSATLRGEDKKSVLFELAALREGPAGGEDCLPGYVGPVSCAVVTPLPVRPLTEEEIQRVRQTFSSVIVHDQPDPICDEIILEPCLINRMRWDDFSVTDSICDGPRLANASSAAVLELLEELSFLDLTPSATPSITPTPSLTPTPTRTSSSRPTPTPTVPPCDGDCNGDGLVTVNELLLGVNLLLGSSGALAQCPASDASRDGTVTVDDVVSAVVAALEGCVPPPFPVGAYFWPDHAFGQTGSALADLAGFGLNTVVAYYEYVKPDAPPFGAQPDCHGLVEEADRFEIDFFIGSPRGQQLHSMTDAEIQALFAATVECVGDSPFYRGWMFDEPELTGYDPPLLARTAAALRAIDPNRRIWVNFSPHARDEQLRSYAATADIVGIDIYPIREGDGSYLDNLPLHAVGEHTERARAAVEDWVDVWMILQAFGYSDLPNEGGRGRRPTPGELRFMAYDALVHGARGVIFFGSHQLRNLIPLDEPVWNTAVRTLARELQVIGPTLRLGETNDSLVVEPPFVVARSARWMGREIVIAVNESDQAISAAILLEQPAAHAHELFERRPANIQDRRIIDAFPPWGVHVYAVTR